MQRFLFFSAQVFLTPFKKLKAALRRNAIIIAHMTPEQLRERKRMREELRGARDRQREFLVVQRPPGSRF